MSRASKSLSSTPAESVHLLNRYMSDANREKLFAVMREIPVSGGTYLFMDGDEANHMIYVVNGEIKIHKITEDGKELILQFLGPGDLFGEFGGLSHTFNFSAQATLDSQVGLIPIAELEKLIAEGGSFALEFMKWLGLLHRITQSKFRDLMMFGKTGAIASTLIRLCNSYGVATPEGIRINLKVTHADLARMAGTTREGVTRQLHGYLQEDILRMVDGFLVVRQLKHLRDAVCCPDCPAEICRI